MNILKRRLLLSVTTFIAIYSIFIFSAFAEYRRAYEADKDSARNTLTIVKTNIENTLASNIMGTAGLVAYIQSNPDINQESYANFTKFLINSDNPIIRNISALKDTTIAFVYPIKGNETVIGKNLATIEGQKESILWVKNNHRMRLMAPVKLLQGGTGIIIRVPVILENQNTKTKSYWGQVSIVFDYDKVLTKSGLISLGKNNLAVLYEKNPNTNKPKIIWSNINSIPPNAISQTIHLYQSEWELAMIPKNNWKGTSNLFYTLLILGLISSGIASYAIWSLVASKETLEEKVEERTAALIQTNEHLEKYIDELKNTQHQLVESEKLAALGELVAGVTHEIITPLGIGVTLSSYLASIHKEMRTHFEENTLNRSAMTEYIKNSSETLEILEANLGKASTLVASFKQMSTDQANQEKRRFVVKETLQDILNSLQPKFKRTPYTIHFVCDNKIVITSYPGALSQILTNLMINSLMHGFNDRDEGNIYIEFTRSDSDLTLTYKDDGVGIPEEHLGKVFSPFFSTRKDSGGTGLGLHIVNTIVSQVLMGTITLESKPMEGVLFTISFKDSPFVIDADTQSD